MKSPGKPAQKPAAKKATPPKGPMPFTPMTAAMNPGKTKMAKGGIKMSQGGELKRDPLRPENRDPSYNPYRKAKDGAHIDPGEGDNVPTYRTVNPHHRNPRSFGQVGERIRDGEPDRFDDKQRGYAKGGMPFGKVAPPTKPKTPKAPTAKSGGPHIPTPALRLPRGPRMPQPPGMSKGGLKSGKKC